jgi:AcrR family transcriptional regulator
MTSKPTPNPLKISDSVSHTMPQAPKSTPRDARMVRSDTALRHAFLALLDRKPLDQITIREIAAEAGVHYATFFRHHPTKEALLDHVAADQIHRLVELALPVEEAADYHAGFVALCAYVDDHRKLWTALLTGGAAGAMREELLRVSLDVTAGRPSPDILLPVELAVACTVSLIVDTISWWLRQAPDSCSPEQVAALLDRLIVSSILVNDAGRNES